MRTLRGMACFCLIGLAAVVQSESTVLAQDHAAVWQIKGAFSSVSPSGTRVVIFSVKDIDEDYASGSLVVLNRENPSQRTLIPYELNGWPIVHWLSEDQFAFSEELGSKLYLCTLGKDNPKLTMLLVAKEKYSLGAFVPSPDGKHWAVQYNRFKKGVAEVRLFEFSNDRLTDAGQVYQQRVHYDRCGVFRLGLAWSDNGETLGIATIDPDEEIHCIEPDSPNRSLKQERRSFLTRWRPPSNLGGWAMDMFRIGNQELLAPYNEKTILVANLRSGQVHKEEIPAGEVTFLSHTNEGDLVGLLVKSADGSLSTGCLLRLTSGGVETLFSVPGIVRWSDGRVVIWEKGIGLGVVVSLSQVSKVK